MGPHRNPRFRSAKPSFRLRIRSPRTPRRPLLRLAMSTTDCRDFFLGVGLRGSVMLTGTLTVVIKGTHMTWGVNLGLDNATNAGNMARAILNAFSSSAVRSSGVVLDLIELGGYG